MEIAQIVNSQKPLKPNMAMVKQLMQHLVITPEMIKKKLKRNEFKITPIKAAEAEDTDINLKEEHQEVANHTVSPAATEAMEPHPEESDIIPVTTPGKEAQEEPTSPQSSELDPVSPNLVSSELSFEESRDHLEDDFIEEQSVVPTTVTISSQARRSLRTSGRSSVNVSPIKPTIKKVSPTLRKVSPIAKKFSPTVRKISPIVKKLSPIAKKLSPIVRKISHPIKKISPTAKRTASKDSSPGLIKARGKRVSISPSAKVARAKKSAKRKTQTKKQQKAQKTENQSKPIKKVPQAKGITSKKRSVQRVSIAPLKSSQENIDPQMPKIKKVVLRCAGPKSLISSKKSGTGSVLRALQDTEVKPTVELQTLEAQCTPPMEETATVQKPVSNSKITPRKSNLDAKISPPILMYTKKATPIKICTPERKRTPKRKRVEALSELEIEGLKRSIVTEIVEGLERVTMKQMLKILKHDLIVHPPHFALAAMLDDIQLDSKSTISDYAYEVLEDFYYTNALICYGPHIIAASALIVAGRGNEQITQWFGEIDFDRKQVKGCVAMLMELYRTKKDLSKAYEQLLQLQEVRYSANVEASPIL